MKVTVGSQQTTNCDLMRRRSPRSSKKVVLYSGSGWDTVWAERGNITALKKKNPLKRKRHRGYCPPKISCPDIVPHCTIMCSTTQIGAVLDGSQCLVTGCEGLRRIADCNGGTHGGCAVFKLRCSRCNKKDL